MIKLTFIKGNSLYEFILFITLLLLNFATRIFWTVHYPAQPDSDGFNYYMIARSLVTDETFSLHGKPDVYWPPLWPLIMAGVMWLNSSGTYLQGVILGVQLVTAVLIWQIARMLSSNLLVAVIPLILFAVNPSHLLMSNTYATEPLFTMLLIFTVYIILKVTSLQRINSTNNQHSTGVSAVAETSPVSNTSYITHAIFAGLTLGLATITRGTTLPLIALLFLLYLIRINNGYLFKIPVRFWLIVVLISIIPVVWWSYRNYKVSGGMIIISNVGAENFWFGNNPTCLFRWLPPDYPCERPPAEFSPAEKYHWWNREALKFILQHPLATVLGWVTKTWYLFYPDLYDTCFNISFPQRCGSVVFFIWKGLNQLIWILTVIGFLAFLLFHYVLPIKTKIIYDTEQIQLVIWLIVYWIGVHCLTLGHPRYRYPIEHYFWMLAALGYLKLLFIRRTWRKQPQFTIVES